MNVLEKSMRDYGINRLVIGARGSPLSLAQTRQFRAAWAARMGLGADEVETLLPIEPVITAGDRIQDRTLQAAGGKGLFTKELDDALLAGSIDLAVHSMKDLPAVLPDGLALAATPMREDPRDVFVSYEYGDFDALPIGARLGTASVRRRAQALARRPDLQIAPLRGNVDTRLGKVRSGEFDATFLALAGLRRLGRLDAPFHPLEFDAFLPAPCQGALAVTIRTADADIGALLEGIADPGATRTIAAERAFLQRLDGSCTTPIAAHAQLAGNVLHLTGELLTVDGTAVWRDALTNAAGPGADAGLGRALAERLLAAAGPDFVRLAHERVRP